MRLKCKSDSAGDEKNTHSINYRRVCFRHLLSLYHYTLGIFIDLTRQRQCMPVALLGERCAKCNALKRRSAVGLHSTIPENR